MLVPMGFGLIYQGIIYEEMKENGMEIALSKIPIAMVLPVIGMEIGLIIAIVFTYRKPREYKDIETEFSDEEALAEEEELKLEWQHTATLLGILVTVALQVFYDSLVLAALGGIMTIFIFRAEKWKNGDSIAEDGVKMMGVIAFVMLIASGYASVLQEAGSVDE